MLYRGKPPMGWNSWDCYGDSVNEEQLLANAAALAKLKDCGWQYVVCDIQWSEPTADGYAYHNFAELCMDEYSRLIPSPERFPSAANGAGFRPIADKIHAMGLKFGIHIMRGIPRQAVHRNTPLFGTAATARDVAQQYSICPWNTDMYGVDPDREGAQAYYDSLLALYAEWGVDYIKCDDIANTEFTARSFSAFRPVPRRLPNTSIWRRTPPCGVSAAISGINGLACWRCSGSAAPGRPTCVTALIPTAICSRSARSPCPRARAKPASPPPNSAPCFRCGAFSVRR